MLDRLADCRLYFATLRFDAMISDNTLKRIQNYGAIEVPPQFYFRNLFSRHLFLFAQDFILFSVVYVLFSWDLFLFVQDFCFCDFSYLGKTKINVVTCISNLCCSLNIWLFASLWVQDNGLLSRDNKNIILWKQKKMSCNTIFFCIARHFILFYRDTKSR